MASSSSSSSISSGSSSFKPRLFLDTLLGLDPAEVRVPTHPAVRIFDAALEGDIPRMKELVELRRAEGKSVAVVEEIRDSQNSRSLGALHVAAHAGKLEMCKFLIEDLHLDVNAAAQHGSSPLICAAYGNKLPIVKLLLDCGADPNIASKEGFTVLHVLATKDRLQIAEMLLSRGANVDSMSKEGTPLHIAAQCGNAPMMKVLLKYKANPNRVVQLSYAPLTLALFASSSECVELLIKAGADVNAARPVTPLIIAARDGLADCIKCLLKAGADPNSPDEIGRMPVEIAAIHGWKECVEILFPVTPRVDKFADWSIDGIMQHVKSGSSEGHLLKSVQAAFKAPGDSAFARKDFAKASTLYTKVYFEPEDVKACIVTCGCLCPGLNTVIRELVCGLSHMYNVNDIFAIQAIETGPENPDLYAMRCLCWLEMGEKHKALDDADICENIGLYVSIRYHEQGPALIPMEDYGQSSETQLDSGSGPVGGVSGEKDK